MKLLNSNKMTFENPELNEDFNKIIDLWLETQLETAFGAFKIPNPDGFDVHGEKK